MKWCRARRENSFAPLCTKSNLYSSALPASLRAASSAPLRDKSIYIPPHFRLFIFNYQCKCAAFLFEHCLLTIVWFKVFLHSERNTP